MTTDELVEQALVAAKGDLVEAQARLLLLKEQFKAKTYVKYWEPAGDQVKFWEQLSPEQDTWLVLGGNSCLVEGTLVATPSGPRSIEQLSFGDVVYAGDGTVANVLHRYENGEKEVWRWYGKKRQQELSFSATRDHKVVIATQKDTSPRLIPLDNLSTRSYFALASGTLMPVVDREYIGHLPTYDLLIEHPSHVFQLHNGVQVSNSGKTDLACFLLACWLLGKSYFKGAMNEKWVAALPIPDPPNNVRAVGLNSDMLRDPIWEKLTGSTEHPPFFPQDGSLLHLNNQQFTAKLTCGSKFQGKSADVDPKTHGGPTCTFVGIDEECSYEIFRENMQRTRGGGKILVSATPLDDVGTVQHPWIYDMIEQWKAGDKSLGVVFMSMFNNPYIDADYKRRQKARWAGHPAEQARLYGIPTRRSGLYYKMWKPEPPLWIPAYDLPAHGAYRVCSIDPASTGPVGVVWAAFDIRGKMTIYRTYKQQGLTVSEHVGNILTATQEPIDLWIMDPWRGKQTQEGDGKTVLQVWRDAGLPRLRLPEVKYEVCLEESREYLLAAFDRTNPHPPMEVFDHCEEFRDEIERYVIDSIVRGSRRGETYDRPRKGHDDVLNAWQQMAGMRLRSRNPDYLPQLVEPEFRSYSN